MSESRSGLAHTTIACLALVCGGCASMFIHGGRAVGRGHPLGDATAVYQVESCRDASGGPGQLLNATYYVLPTPSGPELLERDPSGPGVLVSNRWQDAEGTHYFAWGAGFGWEFLLAAGTRQGVRLLHERPSSRVESDGTRRPVVSRVPESTCTLVLVQGAPPSAAPIATAPSFAQPRGAVAASATTSASGGSCAAGRVEIPEGYCCMPGERWDATRRACATGPVVQCAGGRAATADGYCCWPGQRFDPSVRQCAGPPRCPPGLAAIGADCGIAR